MKRSISGLGVAAFLILVVAFLANAAGPFDQKLPLDKQPLHVLSRLTFGSRPGEVEQVRRLGVEKWIDQQLHPDRIPENPILETRLKTLSTLQMPMWQILDKYPAIPPNALIRPPSLGVMLSFPLAQRNQLQNGSLEQRLKALAALDPDKRRLVLAAAPPQMLEGFPEDIQQEAASAKKTEQEEMQKERRKLMPPLMDLLTQDQMRIVNRGTPEEKTKLLNSFDADKRQQVMRVMPVQPLAELPDLRREAMAASQPVVFVNTELIENKLYRAIYSNHQLEEVLVDFWMNHFNVFNGKGVDRVLLTSFERDAIRPYVLGHFKDMLLATARHPAMLFYLDNWQSQVPQDPPFAIFPPEIRRPGLNENYGRELLELHTLGVDGGYTQDDVIAVARAFSGWTIFDQQRFAEYQFNPASHDRKEKIVLGHTIPAMGAEQDGLQVIDILAHHPSTARFISKKLAQRFVADDPPQALVDRMAATFTKTDGDLRAVLQTMFSSVEFMSEGAWQAKMKSPLEMIVGAIRAMNADVTDTFFVAQRIADLGEPLYGKLEPTGYPNTSEAWTNTASVVGRINFAAVLASGKVPGVKVDISRFNFKEPSAVANELLGAAPSASTLSAIQSGIQGKEATPSSLASLVMGSPDFQRR
jgi:uncharacterized protein (DUF1800 family)